MRRGREKKARKRAEEITREEKEEWRKLRGESNRNR